jgi:hypothetical protein
MRIKKTLIKEIASFMYKQCGGNNNMLKSNTHFKCH